MKTKQLPPGWKEVKLGDVAEFINGRAFKPSEWETKGKIIIRIQDLTGNIENPNYTTKTFEGRYLVKEGDLLISWSATLDTFIWNKEEGWLNQHIFKVVEKNTLIYRKFLYYVVKNKIEDFKRETHGSTMKHITKGDFNSIRFYLPSSLKTQKQIVSVLEKVETLKQKREDADKLTKKYLQSVFYEMFGNPAKNPKKLPIRRLEEAASNKGDFVDGPFGSDLKVSHHTEEGVRILQINTIGVGKFLDKNAKYVSEEKYNELIRHNVFPGDIIIAKMGEPIARTCILPAYIKKALVVADCMRLRVTNKKEFDSIYLSYLLNTEFAKNQIDSMTHGSTRIRVNLSMIKNLKIPLPQIELQQKFSSIVEHIEKLKEKQKQSKDEINHMFDSLMKQAFNGELIE